MKVILIEEERFAEICDILRNENVACLESIVDRYKLDQGTAKAIIDDLSRTTNYWFVRWAQSHGASCVHR